MFWGNQISFWAHNRHEFPFASVFEPVKLGINEQREDVTDAWRMEYIDSDSDSDSDVEEDD